MAASTSAINASLLLLFAFSLAPTRSEAPAEEVLVSSVETAPIPRGWVLSKNGYDVEVDTTDRQVIRGRVTPPSFHPPFVEFHKQPLCQPTQEIVVLVNADPRHDLEVYSLQSRSEDFHATWPEKEVIPPGKNTSFSIVYLGESLGRIEAQIMLNTSHGDLSYEVFAESISNGMRTRPQVEGRVAVGSTYVQPIELFNPMDTPVQVLEVISSTPKLQLEISSTESGSKTGKGEAAQPWASSAWSIEPYESRVVIYVHANSDAAGVIEGYINVRTNVTEANAVVPVRVDVSDAVGLYFGPEEMVDFGAVSVTDPPLRYSVKVLSNTEKMLRVMGSTISSCTHVSGDACTGSPKSRELLLHRVVGVMLPKKFFPVGDLVLTPQRGMRPGVHTGRASVFYQIDNRKEELTVPFRYQILEGSLDFQLPLQPVFYLNADPAKIVKRKTVKIFNHFHFDVLLQDVALPDDSSHLFKLERFSPTIVKVNTSANISLVYNPGASEDKEGARPGPIRTELLVHNNVTDTPFRVPVYTYDGSLNISFDGKPLALEKDVDTIDFGVVNMDDTATRIVTIANFNPIQIAVRSVTTTVKSSVVKLEANGEVENEEELQTIASGSKAPPKLKFNNSTRGLRPGKAAPVHTVIKPGHAANVSITVQATSSGKVSGILKIQTKYEMITVNVVYRGMQRTVKLSPATLAFAPALPGKSLKTTKSGTSKIFELQKLEKFKIYVEPEEKGARVEKVYTEDPRFVIKPGAAASPKSDVWKEVGKKVELATIHFTPSLGPSSSNYVPSLSSSYSTLAIPPLNSDTIGEVDRADRVWRRLKKKKQVNITSTIVVDSTANLQKISVTAALRPLTLISVRLVEFPLTKLRFTSEKLLVLTNPTQHPVQVDIEMLDAYGNSPLSVELSNLFGLSSEDLRMAKESKSLFVAEPIKGSNADMIIKPYGEFTFVITYKPEVSGISATTLLVRSNLTIVEKVELRAEAGKGTFGFPKSQPLIVDGGLSFPITAKDLAYCKQPGGIAQDDAKKSFTFNVTVVNRGNMPTKVARMSVDGISCKLDGFSIRHCAPFELKPKKPYTLTVDFAPDFTSSLVKHKLVVHLEGSNRPPLRFLMQAKLPADLARTCQDALPESEMQLKITILIGALTIAMALFLQEHLSGTWWWSRKPKVKKAKAPPSRKNSDAQATKADAQAAAAAAKAAAGVQEAAAAAAAAAKKQVAAAKKQAAASTAASVSTSKKKKGKLQTQAKVEQKESNVESKTTSKESDPSFKGSSSLPAAGADSSNASKPMHAARKGKGKGDGTGGDEAAAAKKGKGAGSVKLSTPVLKKKNLKDLNKKVTSSSPQTTKKKGMMPVVGNAEEVRQAALAAASANKTSLKPDLSGTGIGGPGSVAGEYATTNGSTSDWGAAGTDNFLSGAGYEMLPNGNFSLPPVNDSALGGASGGMFSTSPPDSWALPHTLPSIDRLGGGLVSGTTLPPPGGASPAIGGGQPTTSAGSSPRRTSSGLGKKAPPGFGGSSSPSAGAAAAGSAEATSASSSGIDSWLSGSAVGKSDSDAIVPPSWGAAPGSTVSSGSNWDATKPAASRDAATWDSSAAPHWDTPAAPGGRDGAFENGIFSVSAGSGEYESLQPDDGDAFGGGIGALPSFGAGSSIWSSGGAGGGLELDWATSTDEKKEMNPDVAEWSNDTLGGKW